MTKRILRGDAPAQAQISRLASQATGLITLGINGKTGVAVSSWNAAAIAAAWNASKLPEFAEVTATVDGADVLLTSDTPGQPFEVSGLVNGEPTADDEQLVTLSPAGSAIAGTFPLTFAGQTAAGISATSLPSVVEAALEALSSIGAGNVQVTGEPGAWRVRFVGDLADVDQPELTTDRTNLTGGNAAVSIATLQDGTGSTSPLLVTQEVAGVAGTNEQQRFRFNADPGVALSTMTLRWAYRNRLLGMAETTAAALVFLDADDVLPPRYLEAALAIMERDAGIGIVHTDFELFGDQTGLRELTPRNIEHSNYIHCAALVRRAALQAVDWPAHATAGYSHEDWFMWRQVVRLGWRVAKSPVPLRYRRHGTSMMATGGGRYEYIQFANLGLETVQIVLPVAGRAEWLPRLQCWVERQTWPRISVLVLDTSPDPALRRDIRQWLATLHCETQYLPLPPTGAVANLERRGQPQTVNTVQQLMPRIYLQAVQRLTREFVMWVEDDVLPPLDAIERLIWRMSATTACVSGVVVSRFTGHLIGWDPGLRTRTSRGRGVERLHGTGFGCLLVRRSALQAHPLHAGGRTHNYDQEFAIDLEPSGMQWLIDWDVLCDHAGIPAENLPLTEP